MSQAGTNGPYGSARFLPSIKVVQYLDSNAQNTDYGYVRSPMCVSTVKLEYTSVLVIESSLHGLSRGCCHEKTSDLPSPRFAKFQAIFSGPSLNRCHLLPKCQRVAYPLLPKRYRRDLDIPRGAHLPVHRYIPGKLTCCSRILSRMVRTDAR